MRKLLLKFGLEEKEADIYLACLEKELNTPTEIARKTGIKRTTVYFYLEKLLEKGLVSYKIHKAKKYVQALPLRKALSEYVKKNKEDLTEQEKIIEKLPADKIAKPENAQTQVYYYEGKAGARLVVYKILAQKKDIYWLGSIETILAVIDEKKFYKMFTIKRMSQNTSAFALTDKKILNYPRFSEMLGKKFRSIKFLDKNFDLPTLLVLFEGTVCLISKDSKIHTVIIEDDLIYQMIYFLFQSSWNTRPPFVVEK
ncbi:MAG: winged helix-turn-helix transcriptional regulator [bacterium]|nr:winged helix-turn-helix transcriptional regulator [bacterium]